MFSYEWSWGIGKTYLWKQVENKLSEINADKKVVYIDLFGITLATALNLISSLS